MTNIPVNAPAIRVREIHFPTNKISSFQELAVRIATYAAQFIEMILSPVSALVATIDCLSSNTYALKASVNYNLKVTAKISLLVYSIFSFKREKTALLQRAMEKEHYDIARYMLYKGISPITKTPENSPLVIAAENGHVDLVKHMLAKGKNHPSKDERQQVEKAALEKVIHKIIQGEGSWEIFHRLTQASLEEPNAPVESLFSTNILPIKNLEIRNYMALVFFTNSPSAKVVFLKKVKGIQIQGHETLVEMFIKNRALKAQKTSSINSVIPAKDQPIGKSLSEHDYKQSHLDYSDAPNPLNDISPEDIKLENDYYAKFVTCFKEVKQSVVINTITDELDTLALKMAFHYKQKNFKIGTDNLGTDNQGIETFISSVIETGSWSSWMVMSTLKYALSHGFKPSDNFIAAIIKKENTNLIMLLLQHGICSKTLIDQLEANKPSQPYDYSGSRLAGFIIRAITTIEIYKYWEDEIFSSNKPIQQDIGDNYPPKIEHDDDKLAIKTIIEREMLRDDQKSYNSLVTFFKNNPQLHFKSTIGIRLAIQKQDLDALNLFISRTDLEYLIETDNFFLPRDDCKSMLKEFAEAGGIDRTYLTKEEFVQEYNRRFPENSNFDRTRLRIIYALRQTGIFPKQQQNKHNADCEGQIMDLSNRIGDLKSIDLETVDECPEKTVVDEIRKLTDKTPHTVFKLLKRHLLNSEDNNLSAAAALKRLKVELHPDKAGGEKTHSNGYIRQQLFHITCAIYGFYSASQPSW